MFFTDVFPKTSVGRLVMHYTTDWVVVIADKVASEPGVLTGNRAIVVERQPLALAATAESGVDHWHVYSHNYLANVADCDTLQQAKEVMALAESGGAYGDRLSIVACNVPRYVGVH